ncbi:hypothetical protein BD770DRAFT_238245 [Pilaira anomala]|nr:hypothetical protein BD770DRAFT_238245 [Pilaira anomala]
MTHLFFFIIYLFNCPFTMYYNHLIFPFLPYSKSFKLFLSLSLSLALSLSYIRLISPPFRSFFPSNLFFPITTIVALLSIYPPIHLCPVSFLKLCTYNLFTQAFDKDTQ